MNTETVEKKYERLPLGISGLGGWLVLVQIGLYATVIALIVQLFQNSLYAFDRDTWNVLTSSGSELFHPMWGPIIVGESIYNVLFLVYTIYALINFYRKKSILPRLMIIFYSASLIIGIIDSLLVYQIELAREADGGTLIRDTFRSLITCLIWIPYFLKSERVRNTFIR